MKIRADFVTVILLSLVTSFPVFAVENAPPKTIRYTISPETTVLTEPRLPDGRVDYYAAMNQKYAFGVTKESNVMTALFQLLPGELEYPLIRAHIDGKPMDEFKDQLAVRNEYWNILGYDHPTPVESLRTLFPPQSESERSVLESWLKVHTPEEIIAKLRDDQKPKDDAEPLQFLKEMDQWELRVLMNIECAKTHRAFWTEKDSPIMKEWIETTSDLESQLIAISRRPKYFNPLITYGYGDRSLVGCMLPYVQTVREVGRFLSSRGNMHFPAGRHDEAFECALATKRYARVLRTNSGFLVEELIGNALDGIAQDRFVAYLEALEGEKDAKWIMEKKAEFMKIEQEIPLPHIPKAFFGERCMALSVLQEISVMPTEKFSKEFSEEYFDEDEKRERADLNAKFNTFMNAKAETLNWDKMFRLINAHYDEIEDCLALEQRWRQIRVAERQMNQVITLKDELEKRDPSGDPEAFVADYVILLMSPATHACVGAFTMNECGNKMTELAFSLSAYRADHGKYPENIEQLVPKYLESLPLSPYNDKPLRYLNREREILITGDVDYILDGSDEVLEKELQETKDRNERFAHPKIPGSPIVILKKRPAAD